MVGTVGTGCQHLAGLGIDDVLTTDFQKPGSRCKPAMAGGAVSYDHFCFGLNNIIKLVFGINPHGSGNTTHNTRRRRHRAKTREGSW